MWVQDDVIKAAHVESEDGGGRFTVTQALKDQTVIDLSKVGLPSLLVLLSMIRAGILHCLPSQAESTLLFFRVRSGRAVCVCMRRCVPWVSKIPFFDSDPPQISFVPV